MTECKAVMECFINQCCFSNSSAPIHRDKFSPVPLISAEQFFLFRLPSDHDNPVPLILPEFDFYADSGKFNCQNRIIFLRICQEQQWSFRARPIFWEKASSPRIIWLFPEEREGIDCAKALNPTYLTFFCHIIIPYSSLRRKRLTPLSKNFFHFHFKNPFLLNERGEPVRAVTRKEGGNVP